MPQDRFTRTFWIIAGIHAGLVLLLIAGTFLQHLIFRRKPKEVITFVTLHTPAPSAPSVTTVEAPPAPPPPPPPAPPEVPVIVPEPPKPKPKPKIERSTERVRRDRPPPQEPRLTPEELQRRLRDALPAGSPTTSTAFDPINDYYGLVFRTFFDAWIQPGSVPPGTVTEARIRVARNGQIMHRELTRRSGNAVMDDSVMKALNAVQRLRELPPEIKGAHHDIRIEFELAR